MKKLIVLVLLAAILAIISWFYFNGTKTSSNIYTYDNISFEKPQDYEVILEDYPSGQGIHIHTFNLDTADYEADPRFSKEDLQKYYNDLQNGDASAFSPFSSWALKESIQDKITKEGKHFRISTTFAAYEVCDLQFSSRIEIPTDNKIVSIVFDGAVEQISVSLKDRDLMTTHLGCPGPSFKENGQKLFYSELTAENSSPEAQKWYNDFMKIVNSLEF